MNTYIFKCALAVNKLGDFVQSAPDALLPKS